MDIKFFKGLLFLSTTLFITVSTLSQTARPIRQGSSSRALGISPKSSSSGVDFQCPEEFGYYPHPSDCSQYYVCVFGGALLESCTGGLMYSNELQTCDWPRNVGCEVAEITAPSAPAAARESPRAQPHTSRVRFSSIPSGPSGPSGPSAPSAPARIQQISSSQVYPPPPEPLRVAPNPIITTRGQPRNLPHQEDIAKLYAEAHDTLPPIREDEETDTQQRVYRGQPSIVSQVHRDRDGILQQPSVNAIPTQTKVGSFAYVPQVQNFSLTSIDTNDLDDERSTILDRRKRDTLTDDTKELLDTSADGDSVRKARQLLLSWQGRDHRDHNNHNFRSIEYQSPSKHNSFLGFEPYTSPKPPVYAALYKSNGNGNRFYPPEREESSVYSGSYQKKKQYSDSDFKPIGNLRPVYENDEGKGELSPFRQYKTTARPPLVTPLFPVVYTSSNGAPPKKPPPYNYNVKESAYQTTTPDSSEETIPDNFSFFHFRPSSTPKPVQKQYANKPTQISFFPSSTPKNPFLAFQAIVSNYFAPGGGNVKQQSNKVKQETAFRASPRRPDDDNSQEFVPHIPKPTILVPVSGKHGNYAPHVQVTTLRPATQSSQAFTPKAPTTYSYHLLPNPSKQYQKPETLKPTTSSPPTFIITKAIGHHYSLSPQIQVTTPGGKVTHSQYYTQKVTPSVPQTETEKFVSAIKNTHLTQVNSKMIEKNVAGIGAGYYKNLSGAGVVKPIVNQNNNYIKYSTTVKPVTEDEYYDYYDDYEERLTTLPVRSTTIPNQNILNNHQQQKVVKPNIQKLIQNVNEIPKYIKDNPIEANPHEYEDSDEYYDEYDDEDDEEYVPPSLNVNAYRPASETAAPRRITTTTSRPMRPSTPFGGLANEQHRQQTTTTSRPSTNTERSSIPPIIKFPDDPFQNYKLGTFPRYLNKSTLRPYTVRHRIKPTIVPTTDDHQTTLFEQKYPATKKGQTTPVVPTTTTTTTPKNKTTRKIYTVRPNRGNLKWKLKQNGTDKGSRNNGRKVMTNKGRLELDENYPNRVESSSPSSNSQQKASYNKNYYNASNNYNPSNYDSYYTVYDDDVELYRDSDYQPQPQPQYNQNQNQNKQTVSSTYRPTSITPSTLSTQRESYVTQRPQTTYHASSPVYDYDDALVAQLEEDDRYTRPSSSSSSRGHIRGGSRLHNDVHNSITERPSYVSSTTTARSSNRNNLNSNYNNSPRYSSTAYVTTPFSSRISSPNAITSTPAPAIVVRSRYISTSTPSTTTTTQASRDYTIQENQRLNLAEQSSVNKLNQTKQINLTSAGPIINNNITQKATTTKTTTTTTTPKSPNLNFHAKTKVDDFVSLKNDKKHFDTKKIVDVDDDDDDDRDDEEEELTLVAITPRKNVVTPTSSPTPEKQSKDFVNKTSVSHPDPISDPNPESPSSPSYDTYYYDYEPFDENSEFDDDDSETIIITQQKRNNGPVVAPSRLVPHSFQVDQNLSGQGSEHVSVEEVAAINKLSTTTTTTQGPIRGRYVARESEKQMTEEQKKRIKSYIETENDPQTFKPVTKVQEEQEVVEEEEDEEVPDDYVSIPARRPRIYPRTSTSTTTTTTTSTTPPTTTTTTTTTSTTPVPTTTTISTTPPTTTTSTTTTVQPTTQKIVLRNRLQLATSDNQYKQPLDSKLNYSFKDSKVDQSLRSRSSDKRSNKERVKGRNAQILESRKPEKVRRIVNRLPEKLRFVEPTTFAYAPASKLKLIETHKGPIFVEQTTTPITKPSTTSTTTTTTTTEPPTTESGVQDKIELEEVNMESEVPPTNPIIIHNNNHNLNQSLNLSRFVESIQSFTSRGIVFKENLNRSFTPSYYTKAVVSPFDSLAAQKRGEKDKHRSSTVKSSVNSTPLKPIIKGGLVPSRDGFIITSAPSLLGRSLTSTTEATTTTTTTAEIEEDEEEILPVTEVMWSESSTHGTTENPVSEGISATLSPVNVDNGSSNRGRYRPFTTNFESVSYDAVESTTGQPLHVRARNPIRKFTPPVLLGSSTTEVPNGIRRKLIRVRPTAGFRQKPTTTLATTEAVRDVEEVSDEYEPYESVIANETIPDPTPIVEKEKEQPGIRQRLIFKSFEEDPSIVSTSPRQEALIMPIGMVRKFPEPVRVVQITERPRYFGENKYETTQTAVDPDRTTKRFRATIEMPEMRVPEQIPLEVSSEATQVQDEDDDSSPENDQHIAHFIDPDIGDESEEDDDDYAFIETTPADTLRAVAYDDESTRVKTSTTTSTTERPSTEEPRTEKTTTQRQTTTTMDLSPSTTHPRSMLPPRASRINNAIKTTIAAAGIPRRLKPASSYSTSKCNENSPFAKCNEIPSRTNNRNRGGSSSDGQTNSRGTHPPRARPTLKPAAGFVSKAQEFIDIYRFPPTRPDSLYPQPTPDKTAAKCRKDVCLLPDCFCGGKDIPGEVPINQIPQIVLLTFDDSVNDLNKGLYADLFERGRVNPNGCPISATFYVSHEWTDYSQVQNLYSDGHEMASHTVSHSFGEQFSVKKWAREVAGQREILSAYGGVKLEDVRGFRAPFLSIGGNKMFKMLHDFNFTYDSSMPVYENRPPSWPYTLDYKIFHDCMIPPCPTKSYPGVWEVPMVMWQDLNGGRCSMGDACSNPSDAENVEKMIMKNFDRHYSTNRAPFGLFYHAAWFTQPHHKEGFIKFMDKINQMNDVYIVTNWQALQWVRDPTPLSRMNSFQPFQCNYSDRPKRCNNPKVCNLWHKSGVRYMRTCQPCPEIYPWTGKSGIRSSRIDNDLEVADSTN